MVTKWAPRRGNCDLLSLLIWWVCCFVQFCHPSLCHLFFFHIKKGSQHLSNTAQAHTLVIAPQWAFNHTLDLVLKINSPLKVHQWSHQRNEKRGLDASQQYCSFSDEHSLFFPLPAAPRVLDEIFMHRKYQMSQVQTSPCFSILSLTKHWSVASYLGKCRICVYHQWKTSAEHTEKRQAGAEFSVTAGEVFPLAAPRLASALFCARRSL